MRGHIYSDSELKITQAGLKKGSRLASKGSLLILVRGSMLFNKIPIGIASRDVAFNQDVKSIVVSDYSTPEYILNWFLASEAKLLNMVTGTGIGAGKLDLKDLKELEIKIPSLSEQEKIASFLSLITDRIQTQNKIIEELKLLKNTLSKKIFSAQLSFKNENGYVFPRWDSKEVGEIFKITRGNVLAMNLLSNERNKEKPFPVYSSQTKNKGLAGYHSDFLFENAITWTTDGANAGDVNYRIGKFYCTNVCGVLLSKDGYANVCISELINSVSKKYVSYVGNPKLMNGIMAKIKIPFPSLEEQHKIADFLLSIDGKIEIETSILQQLETQKTYFLANLFI